MLKLLCLFGILVSPLAVSAQDPVRLSLKAPPVVKAGEKFIAQVHIQIIDGWHIYSLTQPPGGPAATRIIIARDSVFKIVGTPSGPKPIKNYDSTFELDTETYVGAVRLLLSLAAADEATVQTHKLSIDFKYQACNENSCLPPKTVKLSSDVQVLASERSGQLAATQSSDSISAVPRRPVSPSSSTAPTSNNSVDSLPAATGPLVTNIKPITDHTSASPYGSLLAFIWLAMTMGALSLLTPCVFPMVPITVSYFTNHGAPARFSAIRNALVYVCGIILTFTSLGVVAAFLFGASGTNRFAASPWVNLGIGLVFIAFALSFLGAYTIAIPSRWLTRLDNFSRRKEQKTQGATVTGLLLMALIFSLTSFTCTAPFVGTLLVMAAGGKWFYPVIGLISFSAVFAIPFFALALIPQLIGQLPRPGSWLNTVKVVMGLLEFAAAVKFLANVDMVWHWGLLTRQAVLSVWVAVAAAISLYLLGLVRIKQAESPPAVGPWRLSLAIVFLSISLWLLIGLTGARLGEIESFLPPTNLPEISIAHNQNDELSWITNDYSRALTQAREQHKLVLIDFTGYTCTNCRWMEVNMFTRDSISQQLQKYVRLRLYTDGEGEPYQQQQALQQTRFGTVALPYYAIIDGAGEPISTFAGLTRNEPEFLAFLAR